MITSFLNKTKKYFDFRFEPIIICSIAFLAWIPALLITRDYFLAFGCGIEDTGFIKWLCESYGVSSLYAVLFIRIIVIVGIIIIGARVQRYHGSIMQRRLDTPFPVLILILALIDSISNHFVSIGQTQIVSLIRLGIPISIGVFVLLILIYVISIFNHYYKEKKDG